MQQQTVVLWPPCAATPPHPVLEVCFLPMLLQRMLTTACLWRLSGEENDLCTVGTPVDMCSMFLSYLPSQAQKSDLQQVQIRVS